MGRDLKLDSGSAGILHKSRSFEKDSETPSHGKVIIQKTQSLGSQLLVNIDEGLIDTAINNGFRRYSFSLAGGDISDHIALRVQSQSPNRSKIEILILILVFVFLVQVFFTNRQ